MTTSYSDTLNKQVSLPKEWNDVMAELRQFCDDISSYLSLRGSGRCALEPGFITNYGQEWRPTVHSSSGYEFVLLRAYIPIQGLPVSLDLYEKALRECNNIGDLQAALNEFLSRQETRANLLSIK